MADYSRGVLERFTRCSKATDKHVKTIANPRAIDFLYVPHSAVYFNGAYAVNENGSIVSGPFNESLTAEKIVINHYHTKSLEEFAKKSQRGRSDTEMNTYNIENFDVNANSEEFNDGILKYRDEQAQNFQLPNKSRADERLFSALAKNLSPTLVPNTPPDFYAGKVETFLTCRAIAAYLQTKLTDASPAKFFEEASLKAILKTFTSGTSFADMQLLLSELPELLKLPYPAVEELREACLHIIPQMMNVMRLNTRWKDYVELDYIWRLLQIQK